MRDSWLRLSALLAASLAGGPLPASAVAPLTQPQASFDGSILQPYRNAWRYVAYFPDGTVHPQGIWTDELFKTTQGGRELLVRVQGTVLLNGNTASVVNTFDPRSMVPVSDQQTLKGGGLQKRVFHDGAVEAHRTKAAVAPEESSTTALRQPVFDYYGGMYALLFATAPLKPGYSASFASIDEFEDKTIPVTFKVLGREQVRAGSKGMVEAWRVQSERPGQYDLIAWVTKAAPYVIRLNIILPDRRRFDWTML